MWNLIFPTIVKNQRFFDGEEVMVRDGGDKSSLLVHDFIEASRLRQDFKLGSPCDLQVLLCLSYNYLEDQVSF